MSSPLFRWLKALAATLLMTCVGMGSAAADERIVEFGSVIEIGQDGGLEVTETIVVDAEGDQIRRGIFRDFPTLYQDRSGRRTRVPFEIVSVSRNGAAEPFHTESLDTGIRVYFGSSDHFLEPGRYRYQLRYRTDRQLGYFKSQDELYWNVTGNGWRFPIDSASATVRLPVPVPADRMSVEAYTGRSGARGQDYEAVFPEPGLARVSTTEPLPPNAGLTLVLGFPKGVVAEPTAAQRRAWFWQDNWGLISCAVALVLAFLWFLFAWRRVGRDPASGAIYPRYQPPADYSAAGLRYVWKMGYDRTCTAAALISLAVKDVLDLREREDDWEVSKAGGNTAVDSERGLAKSLFRQGSTLVFEQSNHRRIKSVISAHESALSTALEKRYFRLNRHWLLPGAVLSLAGLLLAALSLPGEQKAIALFLVIFGVFWNFGVYALVVSAWRSWRDLRGMLGLFRALFTSLFALPFVAGTIAVVVVLVVTVGWVAGLLLLLAILLNMIFYHLIKAPTPEGRALLDEIEGLRMYLNVAEQEDLERQFSNRPAPGAASAAPPDQTLEHFEALLPYAVALDAADTWAQRFEEQIRAAEQAGDLHSRGWYQPGMTDSKGFAASDFASSISSGLSSTLSTSASAPGSSSGSGGGGFSGGGGGGGGGGGW